MLPGAGLEATLSPSPIWSLKVRSRSTRSSSAIYLRQEIATNKRLLSTLLYYSIETTHLLLAPYITRIFWLEATGLG